jgi:hypothetical protein
MSAWPQDDHSQTSAPEWVTPDGAAWLASAGAHPRSTLSRWTARPTAPGVLPCGAVFDVVNLPMVFGRRVLDRLWAEGPGSGPVAVYRGRTLLFTEPGTARRLPALLSWEEWGRAERADEVPPVLCHGAGDAVTVPPLAPGPASGPRWLVAPDTREPWLPGPEVLLWACVTAARTAGTADTAALAVPPAGRPTAPSAADTRTAPGPPQAVRGAGLVVPRRPAGSPSLIDFSSRRSGC